MVSILEPFIDTIVVCSVTAMVILSSGVWTEKFENSFDRTSMTVISGVYSDANEDDVIELSKYVQKHAFRDHKLQWSYFFRGWFNSFK